MLTEEEARTKWCPFMRYVFNDLGGGANAWEGKDNVTVRSPNTCRCIASACMAWRWYERPDEACRRTELWSREKNCRVNSAYGDDAWWRPIEHVGEKPPPRRGYCGIAGKPDHA